MELTRTKTLTLAGLMTAATFLLTGYVHVPTGLGYTHLGDSVVFLAAVLLPLPYALGSAVIGAGLADILTGFAVWAPATVVIKALTVLMFSRAKSRRGRIIALAGAWAVCVAGYSLYQAAFMTDGGFIAALPLAFAQTPAYTVQIALGYLLFAVLRARLIKE